MRHLLPALLILPILLVSALPARGNVEVGRAGRNPATIAEVYLREGTAFLPLDDVLGALDLRGHWDSVGHRYVIRTPAGEATLFPGGHYLAVGDRFLPLSHPPRFIDGRLRVAEDFLTGPLAELVGFRVYYRNLTPAETPVDHNATALDRLFAFLLHQKGEREEAGLRGVAIDPGHGGQDVGSLGGDLREKDLTLTLATDLEKQLKMQLGIPVYLTRDADYSLSLPARLEAAARPDVDALLQLHVQSAPASPPGGVMFFVRPFEEGQGAAVPAEDGRSMALARELAAAVRAAGIPVAGIFAAPLRPLGRGDLPTVLVEAGFLSNPGDRARLADPAARGELVRALYAGLRDFGANAKETTR